jgi:hypothetical protein
LTTPGYPQQQPQPPYPGARRRAKKSRKTLWIVLGVVGVIALICCGAGAFSLMAGKKAVDKPAAKGNVKQGQPARDGKFEFTVTKIKYGKTQVGDQFLNKTAQGQYVLLSVTVRNIGSEAKMFDGYSQKAVGAGGVKYEHDGAAELYANSQAQAFLNTINPGNSVQGVLVFDIPKDAKLVTLELHDSPFSGGVKVDLT